MVLPVRLTGKSGSDRHTDRQANSKMANQEETWINQSERKQ